jgi:glutamyl-tRNA synthetase
MLDESGHRLAKRHDSLSLRTLRQQNRKPAELRQAWPPPGG